MVKPFSPREVVARVKALLRRSGAVSEPYAPAAFERGRLRIDFSTYEVFVEGKRHELALREFELAISIDRNLAVAHAYAGLMKLYLGRFAETEGHVAEALRLSPRDPLE